MVQFSIKFDDTEIKKEFNRLELKMRNTKPLMDEIADSMLDVYQKENFAKQGKAVGSQWKPLSPVTKAARAKRTGYYKQQPKKTGVPLIWTGRLQEGFRKKVSRTKAVLSNKVDYFRKHQLGEGNVPQRKLIGVTKNIIADVEKILVKHFKRR